MSRGAFLTGTAGGIIGTITSLFVMACIGITNNYIIEIRNYPGDLLIWMLSGFDILYYPTPPYFA